MTETITVKFDTDGDIVHVSVPEYTIETVPPSIVVQALRDLADVEEESYRRWNALYERRN